MKFEEAKKIFDSFVSKDPKWACHWVDDGQHWYACKGAILCHNEEAENTPVKPYKGKPAPPQLVQKPSIVYPENFLEEQHEEVTREFFDCISIGTALVATAGNSFVTKHEHAIKHHIYKGPEIPEDAKLKVSFYKANGNPVLEVEFEDGQLYLPYEHVEVPENITLELPGGACTLAQWSDKEKCYKKLRKENKMALAPEKFVKELLNKNMNELKFDPSKPGKENDGTEGLTLEEAVQEPVKEKEAPKEEPVKEAAKPVEEAPKEEVKAEPAKEEPVKRTRKKAETTPVNDLTKIIEQLSGAVPEMSAEERIKAVRQLRDLQLAATRRIANISLQYIESTQGMEAKLAAIKAAL